MKITRTLQEPPAKPVRGRERNLFHLTRSDDALVSGRERPLLHAGNLLSARVRCLFLFSFF